MVVVVSGVGGGGGGVVVVVGGGGGGREATDCEVMVEEALAVRGGGRRGWFSGERTVVGGIDWIWIGRNERGGRRGCGEARLARMVESGDMPGKLWLRLGFGLVKGTGLVRKGLDWDWYGYESALGSETVSLTAEDCRPLPVPTGREEYPEVDEKPR